MRRIAVLLGGLWIGCAASPDFDLGGSWTFSENFTSTTGISCTVTGDLLIAHDGGSNLFGGIASRNAECTGAPEGFDPGGADEIIRAEIKGSDVEFTIDLCEYQGTLSSATGMSGSSTCELGVGGQPTQFSGTWEANRAQG